MSQQQYEVNISSQQSFQYNHGYLGLLSGMIVGTILQPLEIIKMGIIIGPANNKNLSIEIGKSNLIRQAIIVGKYLFKTEGAKGFLRGLTPSLLRNGGGSAVYFYTLSELDQLSNKYFDFQHKKQFKDCSSCHFLNSAIARIVSTLFINPISVVGSRIEVPGFFEYKNIFDGMKKLYQAEGIKGYFRGVWPTCLKDGPFAGFYLMLYRKIKHFLEDSLDLHYAGVSMTSGIIAGVIATASSHPFEIIRARMQVNNLIPQSGQNDCEGVIDGLKHIYKYEGIHGFFRGITPRLVKKPIANASTFAMFEFFHYNFNEKKW